jgi:hypothetical protein
MVVPCTTGIGIQDKNPPYVSSFSSEVSLCRATLLLGVQARLVTANPLYAESVQ